MVIVLVDIVDAAPPSSTSRINEYQLTLLKLIELVIRLYRRRPNLSIGIYNNNSLQIV